MDPMGLQLRYLEGKSTQVKDPTRINEQANDLVKKIGGKAT